MTNKSIFTCNLVASDGSSQGVDVDVDSFPVNGSTEDMDAWSNKLFKVAKANIGMFYGYEKHVALMAKLDAELPPGWRDDTHYVPTP